MRISRSSRLALIAAGSVLFFSAAMPFANAASLNAYRWRNDDGSEAAATFKAAENTAITGVAKNAAMRLRFGAANDGKVRKLLENASTALNSGENDLHASVIDTTAGYAYFGTQSTLGIPCKIIKVRLSDNAKVGVLPLAIGENDCGAAVIDTTNATHYAYFGVNTSPGKVVRIDLSSFTEVGAVPFGAGENLPVSGTAVIDTVTEFAYFATVTSPGKVVKIDINPVHGFAEVDSLTFGGGEDYPHAAVIETSTATHYAYFSTTGLPAMIVKIDLNTFLETGDSPLVLAGNETEGFSADIDVANKIAYFGGSDAGGCGCGAIEKIDVDPSHVFAEVGTALDLTTPAAPSPNALVVDSGNGFAYAGAQTSPGVIVKIDLTSFTEVDSLATDVNGNDFETAVIDATGGFAYFGDKSEPGKVYKIDLSSFTEASGSPLVLTSTDSYPSSSVIDTTGGYAYFGMNSSPGVIAKIRLSDNAEVASITLAEGESGILSGVIDPTGGYAYFGTDTAPASIVKIRLSDFTEIPSLPLVDGENYLSTAVIDTTGGYAYFAADTSPGMIAKIRLSDFSEMTPLTIGENLPYVSTIDTTGGYAYFATETAPSTVVKIRLSDFHEMPPRTLTGENYPSAAMIDTTAGYAYIVFPNTPSLIAKIRLSDFTELTPLSLNGGEDGATGAVIDPANNYIYVANGTSPSIISKVRLSDFSDVGTITLNVGEDSPATGVIDSTNGFAYFGTGDSPANVVKIDVGPAAIDPAFLLEFGTKTSTCSAIVSWTAVTTGGGGIAWMSPTSTHVADGDPTTNNAGLTPGNIVFVPGEVRVNSGAATDPITLGITDFTQLEYTLEATSDAAAGGSYCFRLTDAGDASTFTYAQYAEATLASAGGGSGQQNQPPSVVIASTNEGESWNAGSTYPILWGSGGGGNPTITLLLSTDGGATYPTTIASGLPNNGFYSWTVPSMTTTTTARVEVEAVSSGTVVASSASAMNFTIVGTTPGAGGGGSGPGAGGGGGASSGGGASAPASPSAPGSFTDTTSTFPPGTNDPVPYSDIEKAAPPTDPTAVGGYSAGVAAASTPSIDVDLGILPPAPGVKLPCIGGSLIKTPANAAVYYCAKNGHRYDFPNEKTYSSWYADFAAVKTLGSADLAAIPLTANVTYKPGVRLVKIQTDPKVYAVARDGLLRWITSESLAVALYGPNWKAQVDDVSDAFFGDYTIGDPITLANP